MSTALITGAGGFVGQHLAHHLLASGHTVVGATLTGEPPNRGTLSDEELRRVRWVPLDLTSDSLVRSAVELADPDLVFHLAAQSSVGGSFADPIGTWDVNATGTVRLLLQLRDRSARRVRFLLISSAEVYGAVPEADQPIVEDRVLSPGNPYAASKAAAEMAAHAAAGGGLSVVIARSFNHTGPGQDLRFALPSFARQLREIRGGKRPALLRVGNLDVRRDFLDVRDVVRAYLLLAERGENRRVYNVCSGESVCLQALVNDLVSQSGILARVQIDPDRVRPVEVPVLRGDPSRLRALGWAPQIPIEETLAALLASEAVA